VDNDLISSQEFADIRDVLNDTMYTFLKLDVVYMLDTNSVTRWMRDIATQRVFVNKNMKGLVVWGQKETDQKEIGAYDFGDGYVLLRYDDCVAVGIIDADKNLTVTVPQDKIKFNQLEYYVTCVVKVGQLESTDVLVKVFFRKELKAA